MNEQREVTNDAPTVTSASSSCVVEEEWIDRVVVVSASGVIDMLTAPQLEQAIREAIEKKPAGLVVDFTAVEFLGSAGMGVLVAVHDDVTPDIGFCVVAEGPATSRPLKLVGIADIIQLFATRNEALATLGA